VYVAFSGELEIPEPGEVIFVDGAGRAHARRWMNRQNSYFLSQSLPRLLEDAENRSEGGVSRSGFLIKALVA
jgi:hypothetical protein